MNLQVLVSTMHQTDHSLLEKMNIKSEAIIVNQCNTNNFEEFKYKGNNIRIISLAERGVGLSRNTALMRSTADICLFADDDVTYVDNYKNLVIDAFQQQPDADMIVFNVPSSNPERKSKKIAQHRRVRWFNSLKYGTYRMAIKTESFKEKNIYFSLLFGGGAKYSSGEDSLFIFEAINKGLKVYANPSLIGKVSQKESTWFRGYTDKYFFDKGALYGCLSKKWSNLLALQFVIRHRKMFDKEKNWLNAYKLMADGIKAINK
ncbi:glycosyltransferase family A protein [Robertmurraya massiliosenegalensis]|uniref:glycosyltransferase family A protein n=1 Tax=Robertmurraya TaxID=2837507 RepID=UPI0039A4A848